MTKTSLVLLSLVTLLACTVSTAQDYSVTCENYDLDCPDGFPFVDCFEDLCAMDTAAYQECNTQQLVCYPNYCGGCYSICCEGGIIICDPDVTFTCPDGSTVEKDPNTNCAAFYDCGPCPAERLLCLDGFTEVERDPTNDCDFQQCPTPFVPTCANRNDACENGIPDFTALCLYPPCDDKTCDDAADTCHNAYCGGCNAVCCS